jgi:hypothetical protein
MRREDSICRHSERGRLQLEVGEVVFPVVVSSLSDM